MKYAIATMLILASATAFAQSPKEKLFSVVEQCKNEPTGQQIDQCVLYHYRNATEEQADLFAKAMAKLFSEKGFYKEANEFRSLYRALKSFKTPGEALYEAFDMSAPAHP